MQKLFVPVSMRSKLFSYLFLFVIFITVVLWLFQVVFLDDIYTMISVSNLKKVSRSIALTISQDGIDGAEESTFEHASDSSLCVSVYRFIGSSCSEVIHAHGKGICMLHTFSSVSFIQELRDGAEEREVYSRYIFSGGDGSSGSVAVPDRDVASLITAQLAFFGDKEYMVVIEAFVFPVASTVSALRVILIWVSIILILGALFLAWLISRRIAGPVYSITREAGKLKRGDYSLRCSGGGIRELEVLSETLNRASEELSGLDSMQKELIANISHDLRTPLTMITGYSEAMRDIPGEMNAENMNIIIDEAQRLSSLVSDLLDLSKIQSGQLPMKPEVLSLTEVIREVLLREAHFTEHEGYDIQFISDRDVYIFADRVRLLQVVYNLVNNAICYTGDDKRVTVRQSVNGGVVRIEVIDTGEGIPEEKLAFIWDRYYKVSEYHRRGQVGTGLGLNIVKNILIAHGAGFGVSSLVGKGSIFWFEFPVYG